MLPNGIPAAMPHDVISLHKTPLRTPQLPLPRCYHGTASLFCKQELGIELNMELLYLAFTAAIT